MTLQEALDERLLSPLDLSTVFAVVFVANSLTPEADVVRGIAVENIGTEEVRSSYFSDINQNVKEYENLCDFHIRETMAASTALRQFIADWPEHVTLIGTNVETWLKPLCRSLDEEFELFKGRTYEVVDLGKFCTVTKEFQLNSNSRKLSVVLPTSRFNNKTGSLANLCAASGVYKNSFHSSVYAETRCQMLAEAVRRNLERELFSE
jgi:hypothetical protein